MGQLRHDAGEDDQRDAVADPPRGNLLAEPHQEYGAADQRNGRGNAEEPTWIEHDVASAFEADGDAIALQRGKNHRAVARVLVDLAPSLLAFLLQLLEMWRDRGQELNNDRCRDIRHDVERKDRHAPDRTARERIEHAEDAGLIPLKHLGERLRIDAGNWDVGAEPVDQQRAEREPDALLELVSLGKGREVEVGNELFCGRDHLDASLLSEKREGHWGPPHVTLTCPSWRGSLWPSWPRPHRPWASRTQPWWPSGPGLPQPARPWASCRPWLQPWPTQRRASRPASRP